MATITIGNRTMDAGELRAEIVGFSSDLAKKARVEEPLPEGQDLSESEDIEIQTKIRAMHVLPPKIVDLMMAALCANYASKIAAALHRTSRENQPKAFATYVQLLSLVPEASQEPYYRLFLSSPDSKGLANLLGDAFQKGIQWRRPSGPGTICGLLVDLLFWCDPSEGDDSKAPMDAEVRKQVLAKTTALISNPSFTQLPIEQRADIERLNGVLHAIEQMSGDTYVKGAKETLTAQSGEGVCANEGCGQESKMRCSRCKTVEYCGQKCQSKHWKEAHKIRCFPPP